MSPLELSIYIALFIICLLLAAFFASSETAYISLQKFRIQHMAETRVVKADRILKLIAQPERFLSTVLLGNALFATAATALGTAIAINLLGAGGILVATFIVTVLLLVFGDATPKTVAAQHAERVAMVYLRPMEFISLIFRPVVIAVSWFANLLSRRLGGEPLPRSLATAEEIRTMITVGRQEGTVEDEEAKMLHRVFDFGDRPAREVMTPRPDVVAVVEGSRLKDFLDVYTEHPLSRFPVYKDNLDNILGTLSVKDVLMAVAKGASIENSIDELVRPAYFAPESILINVIFREMQEKNFHMCIVVDEYGSTAGVISLSQLIQEIVGEVGDELATLEKDYEIINEYTFHIDGTMRIGDANQEMGLWLPESDAYETVAGFILCLLGHVPHINETLRYKGLKIVITEMRGPKIEKVLVTREGQRPPQTAAGEPEDAPKCGTGDIT